MVTIINYSDKAIALTGETKPIREQLKNLGGKFNPYLTNKETGAKFAGWIFSKTKQAQVESLINNPLVSIKANEYKPTKSEVLTRTVEVLEPIGLWSSQQIIDKYGFDFEITIESLVNEYLNEVNNSNSLSHLDKSIAGVITIINKESFERYSDKNNITMGLAKSYIRKGGKGIDQVAMEASEQGGINVTEQNVVDFILRYPNKQYLKRSDYALKLAEAYKLYTGKELNRRTANEYLQIIKEVRANLILTNPLNEFSNEPF